jgi:hypothetical protein
MCAVQTPNLVTNENQNTQMNSASPVPTGSLIPGTPLTEASILTAGAAAASVGSPASFPMVVDLTFPEYPQPPKDSLARALAPPPLPDFAAISAAKGVPPPAPPLPSSAPKPFSAPPPPLPMFAIHKPPPAQSTNAPTAPASTKPQAIAAAFSGVLFVSNALLQYTVTPSLYYCGHEQRNAGGSTGMTACAPFDALVIYAVGAQGTVDQEPCTVL